MCTCLSSLGAASTATRQVRRSDWGGGWSKKAHKQASLIGKQGGETLHRDGKTHRKHAACRCTSARAAAATVACSAAFLSAARALSSACLARATWLSRRSCSASSSDACSTHATTATSATLESWQASETRYCCCKSDGRRAAACASKTAGHWLPPLPAQHNSTQSWAGLSAPHQLLSLCRLLLCPT